MLRHTLSIKKRSDHRVWLYSVVFTSRFSAGAILLLLLSFLVQPINQAMAAPDDVDPSLTAETSADAVREQTQAEIPADELVIEDEVTLDSEPAVAPTEESVNEEGSVEVPDTQVDEESDSASSTDTVDDESESDVTPTEGDPTLSDSDETTEVVTETSETLASTTAPIVQAQNLVTDDNFYQFSRQSCVQVGGGTYHCSVSDVSEYDTQSVVYAAADSDGDMEIFLRTARGDVKQVTNNQYDDTAPYYDAESLQLVWQRLLDDRYQIISYDIKADKESQLTYSRTNNMEPKVSEEGIVWQAWDNNDWEIMYFDGSFTEQITDNDAQDVNPVVQDGYILWSVIGRGTQEAKVYSLKSSEILTITGHEGGTIANPRFVLVYDTQFENGDVITQGFDPVTGLSAPIAAKPAPEPVDIPPIDPIGEIRALIQNKSTSEEDQEFDEVPTGDSDVLNLSTSTNNTISSSTLDLKQPVVIEVSTTSSPIVLSEYDLVIPTAPDSTTTTESTQ